MDHTLVDTEIRMAAEKGLIIGFDPKGLKGASYDIRVGDTVIIAEPDPVGVRGISLNIQRSYQLQPGHSCIVSSMEKVKLPADMKGRLSLRSFHQLQGLFCSGGVIDPGYNGFLFFPLANISDSPAELVYGTPLVTCEFVTLGKPAETLYNNGLEITHPQQMLRVPARLTYDFLSMSDKVDGLGAALSQIKTGMQNLETVTLVTQKITDLVIMAALGAVVAAGLLILFYNLPTPYNYLSAVAGLIVALVSMFRRKK